MPLLVKNRAKENIVESCVSSLGIGLWLGIYCCLINFCNLQGKNTKAVRGDLTCQVAVAKLRHFQKDPDNRSSSRLV